MTTIPPTLLTALHETTDPLRRAARLDDLADAHELTGTPNRARLLRLIAATETMLAHPDSDPEDDPAWDEGIWWRLASTTHRLIRAEVLEEIWRDWALAEVGDEDADILLEIADTERHAHELTADLDLSLKNAHETQVADLDAGFDFEAGLADVYVRAASRRPVADARREDVDEVVQADGPDRIVYRPAPSTALRDAVARSAKVFGAALAMAVPVLLVVAPQAPWQLKAASGAAAFLAVLGWVGWTLWRGPDR
ncbi:hypothetical protein ACQP2T_63585 (plasmid) [Nonomuraea sp. CA-143628]|uniref:hypothetical protein n=1 Tax=Nonomuraea sp. CA-143628 TaxID=3239997 RepID=UPI003D8CE5AC